MQLPLHKQLDYGQREYAVLRQQAFDRWLDRLTNTAMGAAEKNEQGRTRFQLRKLTGCGNGLHEDELSSD